ncbi:MAG: glycosyl hydrolase family 2 [Ignavibacteriae bacterium]|nr:MAG: glycosyl hydrolase family 2 [Ignavibacteriota bacterium]
MNGILVPSLFSQSSLFQLAPLFQDNMVLQQQTNVPVWGKGDPGTVIAIQTSWGEKAEAIVQPDGHWMTKIQTPKAGGPLQMSFRHGKYVTVVRNILTGEVWLCSGQSNMEMPLEGWPPSDTIMNSAKEITNALYPSIRLFSVMRSFEPAPMDYCVGSWTECSPLDARTFSATAFYFGKVLHEALHVPIGLINSSFGGTFIEAWMDKNSLSAYEEYTGTLKQLVEGRDKFQSLVEWITKHPAIPITEQDPLRRYVGLPFHDEQCSNKAFNDKTWPEMKLPALWEQTEVGNFDGVVWFRKLVVIPSAWKGHDLTLRLGPIDDMDETFVNGKKVGEHTSDGFWSVDRVYKIPGSVVEDSLLQIAVRVMDLRGGGGLWGKGTNMTLDLDSTNTISLETNWKYLPVAELRSNTFYVYGAEGNEYMQRPKFPINLSQDTPSTLFNGMINPLTPFAIKGAIWYQGENNVSNWWLYKRLLESLINGWRNDFACGDFSFYYVQIAPYDYGEKSKSERLREAQLQAMTVKNSGMVVTMDIGNPKNIHPTNKEDVGKRLAAWALAKDYGKKIPFSGPVYKSMKAANGKLVLAFDFAQKGLVVKERNKENNFLVAGEDKVFKKASVKVEGAKLIVSNPDIAKPVAVRYAWSNMEEGTLFNKEGLPSSSFRTDDWKE